MYPSIFVLSQTYNQLVGFFYKSKILNFEAGVFLIEKIKMHHF